MASERHLIAMERQIRAKMFLIKTKKVTPKDSGIGILLNNLKNFDEALYENLLIEYKKILENINH